ncbi:MAG: SpoIIE family protein phosphatase, partial [Nocardioidaceae bacterium]
MSGDRRLLAYVAALLAATVGTVAAARVFQLHSAGPAVWWAFPILALGLIAAGYLRVKFRRGDDIDALTLFEAVLAPLIFAFPPTVVVLTVAGAHIVVAALRRTTWIKAAFNVVQWSLAAAVGSAVLSALVDGPGMSLESLGWLVIALACVALVNNLAFTLVLSISGRQPVRTVVRGLAPALGWGWLGWGFNVLIGLLFVLAYAGHPIAVVLFPVPLFVLHLAYRGYAAERSDRARLAGLRQAVFTLSAPLQPREAIGDYLREVSETFESHGAGLILLTDGGDFDIHVLEGTGDVTVHTESQQAVSLECLLAAQPEPLRVTSTASNAIAPLLVRSGWRDCICAPLVDDQRRLGALVVFDQIGLEGDTMSDLAVLDALARETAHTIARGRMFESVAEERRKLDQIVGSTSDGIFTLGDDGTVLTWNSGCERITGLAAVDVVGRRHVLRRLRARTALDTPIDFAAWAADPTLPAEVLITRDNGEVRRLSCAATPATNVDGPSQTLVVVARDITPATEYQELREQFSRLVEAQEAQRLVVDHLQQAVTPEPPGIDGVDLAVTYVASDPSSPTGGDLFDWRLLPTGALHICVVDVLGHGVAATKDALTVVHTLRFTAVEGVPLEQMVRRADDLLSAQVSELVATVVIARYDPETGELEVVSGGHPPALVVGADGEVTQLAATGCAIGWPEAGSDNIAKSTLGINDSLVLYTDGLIEARKDVLEGMDSLMEHAGEVAQLPAEQFADELVERSLAGANRRDDSLAMVLRRTRPQVVPHRMRWNVAPGSELALRTARAGLEEWL